MLIHSVYFWLKADLSESETQQFWDGVNTLLTIESVENGFVGKPADTEKRPVVDDTYDCALIVMFKDRITHDAYQEDAIHDEFRNLSHLWERVQIYDSSS